MRSVAYSHKTKSIGPIDVKSVLAKSNSQKPVVSLRNACARITKSASAVRNGLQTVEKMRARSVQTRRLRRGASAGRIRDTGRTPGGTRREGDRPCGGGTHPGLSNRGEW